MRTLWLRKWLSSFVVLLWLSVLIYFLLGVLLSSQRVSPTVMRHFETADPAYSLRHNPRLSPLTVSLMRDLGFVERPKLYPQSYHGEAADLPVFVSAVSTTHLPLLPDFVYSVLRYFPDKRLVIYSLDLAEDQRAKIQAECRCQVRAVQWELYPLHTRNLRLQAFRPLLIQEALREFGGIFWAEADTRFQTSELYPLRRQVSTTGVVAWPLTHPTSTLTHYNMFRYFNTSHEKYRFHRMVEPQRLLLFNTPVIHLRLMLPWVQCALDEDCVAPPGAQPYGCDYRHRPRYIYAGCHKYDMSAFNVALGQAFNLNTPYIAVMDLFSVVAQPSPYRGHSYWARGRNLTLIRGTS